VIEEDRVRTTEAGLKLRFTCVAARVVMEAGTHSPCASRLLEGQGHRVIVATLGRCASFTKAIARTTRSTPGCWRRFVELDLSLLCPIQHRSAEVQPDLACVAGKTRRRGRGRGGAHVRGDCGTLTHFPCRFPRRLLITCSLVLSLGTARLR
jgi:hypothetical protein